MVLLKVVSLYVMIMNYPIVVLIKKLTTKQAVEKDLGTAPTNSN